MQCVPRLHRCRSIGLLKCCCSWWCCCHGSACCACVCMRVRAHLLLRHVLLADDVQARMQRAQQACQPLHHAVLLGGMSGVPAGGGRVQEG